MSDQLGNLDDILDSSIEEKQYSGKTPPGLTALCVLTIVGSGLILLKDMFTYTIFTSFRINNLPGWDWIPFIYGLEGLSCALGIIAAVLLLSRKLVGFYLYIISSAIYVVQMVWFWMVISERQVDEGMIFLILLYLAIPVAFVLMYASFRKYLK